MTGFLEKAGRFIEKLIMGESHYNIYSPNNFDIAPVISDRQKAKTAGSEIQEFLQRELGLTLDNPIIIELFDGSEMNLKGFLRRLDGVMGQYHSESLGKSGHAHMIYIKKDMESKRFKAICAHEMAHAFLKEKGLFTGDRTLREGFARWVEYKTLINLKLNAEAEKLKNLKTLRYGRAVNRFLQVEKETGTTEMVRRMIEKAGKR